MQLAQHRHQALLVERAFLGRQRVAGAQLFEHVVHAGEGQLGVLGLLALAVGVELLGEIADAGGLRGGGVGEGEFLKAVRVVIGRVVAYTQPPANPIGKANVQPGRQHAKLKRVIESENKNLRLRQERGPNELEDPVPRSTGTNRDSLKPCESRSEPSPRFGMNPPVAPIFLPRVLVPLGFDPVVKPLKRIWIRLSQIILREPKGVDHVLNPHRLGQVATGYVTLDQRSNRRLLECFQSVGLNKKALSGKLDTGACQTNVRVQGSEFGSINTNSQVGKDHALNDVEAHFDRIFV